MNQFPRSGAEYRLAMPSAIEVHNLTKQFGPLRAVDDLSFEVAAGRVTGFLGPNGSGKTTTLRMLLDWSRSPEAPPPSVGGATSSWTIRAGTWGGARATSFHRPGGRGHLKSVAVGAGIPSPEWPRPWSWWV